MRSTVFIVCILLMVFPGMLSAELYKYYDKNGTLCFTDNFLMVPSDQRMAIETIHEIKTKSVVSNEPATEKETRSVPGKTIINEAVLKLELEQESKKIETIKKDLDDEYIKLKERRDILILDGKRKMNTKETQYYNQEANKLNSDTKKYKEKKQDYLKRLKEYNLKLESAY
ncbi:MAG: hypothetical protein PF503_13860 [Desulfobacula sp.]|jgi:hypothetical protein|nr:hypothetical protein [Desulfobacula sp.]